MKHSILSSFNFFTFLSFLVLASCKSEKDVGLIVEEEIPVYITSITKSKADVVVEATGMFTTDDETLLSFKNGGIIERIYVKEGDFVKQGQLLATLNMTEINAKATQLKVAMEKAERDFQRAEQLYKDSVATLEQYQNAKTALQIIQQDWNTVAFNLHHSQIRANKDGYVLLKLANEGQVIGPGMPVLQINGAGSSDWMVKVGVSDSQWASIQLGDSVSISTDAFLENLPGKVVRKSEGIDPSSLTFTVSVQPTNAEGLAIATGMFARVKIFGETDELWAVPYSAFFDGNRDKGYLFVTNDKKTVSKLEVTVAEISKDHVLISEGLEDYNFIIVSASPYLKEGAKINVIEEK